MDHPPVRPPGRPLNTLICIGLAVIAPLAMLHFARNRAPGPLLAMTIAISLAAAILIAANQGNVDVSIDINLGAIATAPP